MKHWIRRMSLLLGSIILGVIIAKFICGVMVKQEWVIDVSNMIDVSKVMIGVWGTLLGFIITAESILVAFSNGTITGDFKRTRHYMTVIFQYTQTSIKLLVYILAFVCIIVLKIFTMREMFVFIWFTVMTFFDVFVSFMILILMLRMANN